MSQQIAIFVLLLISVMLYIYYTTKKEEKIEDEEANDYLTETALVRRTYKVPVETVSQPGIGNITPPQTEPITNMIYADVELNFIYKPVYIRHRGSGLFLASVGGVAIGGGSVGFSTSHTEKWMFGSTSGGNKNLGLINAGRTKPVYGFNQDAYDGKNTGVKGLLSFCGGCTADSIPIGVEVLRGDPTGVLIKLFDKDGSKNALSITYEPVGANGEIVPVACVKSYDPGDQSQIFELYNAF